MPEDEDNLTINDVILICKNAKLESIENRTFNSFNTKTTDFIKKYGLSRENIAKIINGLTKDDYHSGPLQDYNPNNKHPLWVFIKEIAIINVRIMIYVKIKIINHRRKIIIYSLHEEGLHDEKK